MLDSKTEKIYTQNLTTLRDVYTELLKVFHENPHYGIQKNVHIAIFEINRAIKDLEVILDEE